MIMSTTSQTVLLPAVGALALALGVSSSSALAAVPSTEIQSDHPLVQRLLGETPMSMTPEGELLAADDSCHVKSEYSKTKEHDKQSFSKTCPSTATAVASNGERLDTEAAAYIHRLLA